MVAEVIPTKVHGVVDYATSGALLAAPELFRLKKVRSSALAPRVAGAASTAYSVLTDYELGVVKALPMKAHLALDAAGGALLAASPWVLGYRRHGVRHWLPHTLVGLSEVAVALTTESESPPERRRRPGKKALIALAVAAPVAGGVAVWRRRSGNGSSGEMFESAGMASSGAPETTAAQQERPGEAEAARQAPAEAT
jgi:hypothetical protein